MKHLFIILATTLLTLVACNNEDTYADRLNRQRHQVNTFLKRGATVIDHATGDTLLHVPAGINVISEVEFLKDTTTDVARNEYVYLERIGVYMQIIRRGPGSIIGQNDPRTVICRYTEYNIAGDSLQTSNVNASNVANPDVFQVVLQAGTLTASYTKGVMLTTYGLTSVPSGWLVPLSYIKLGRQLTETDGIAKVRIILPHEQGHNRARSQVTPFFYEISYTQAP
ncbi:MAG: DUF4827 domain-containing protein [Bacteroidales bacterium]|nr:DUF4827 domain-containing protein [Bacteroidales bacterium]